MTNNDFYWYWFTNIAGIGVKTQKKLLEHFGHPSTIYNAPESEIKGILTTGQCKEVIASKNQKKIEYDSFLCSFHHKAFDECFFPVGTCQTLMGVYAAYPKYEPVRAYGLQGLKNRNADRHL